HQLLWEWNQAAGEYRSEKRIHQLFEEQVGRAPEAVAVVCEDQQVNYRELNARANQLARYLKRVGVGPEVVVGIMLERSIEMVVGLLGILKAGGAFLPLDPTYPPERLSLMIEAAQLRALLTRSNLVRTIRVEAEIEVVCLDIEWEQISQQS